MQNLKIFAAWRRQNFVSDLSSIPVCMWVLYREKHLLHTYTHVTRVRCKCTSRQVQRCNAGKMLKLGRPPTFETFPPCLQSWGKRCTHACTSHYSMHLISLSMCAYDVQHSNIIATYTTTICMARTLVRTYARTYITHMHAYIYCVRSIATCYITWL